jgi:hypothetical protein
MRQDMNYMNESTYGESVGERDGERVGDFDYKTKNGRRFSIHKHECAQDDCKRGILLVGFSPLTETMTGSRC